MKLNSNRGFWDSLQTPSLRFAPFRMTLIRVSLDRDETNLAIEFVFDLLYCYP
jgi:hypothetical protein